MGRINGKKFEEGYSSESGKFLRYDPSGALHASGDRTVASLLASLHIAITDNLDGFNRFYSYTDEIRERRINEDWEEDYSSWLTDDDYIRDANTDFVVDKKDRRGGA